MTGTAPIAPPFALYESADPPGPVMIAVPHAGRAYSPALIRRARVAPADLCRLEDRFADLIIRPMLGSGRTILLANAPRAEIDLNRSEREIDATMVEGLSPRGLDNNARVRGGLGLVPRRLPGLGELWCGRLSHEELRRRIDAVHRPYHAALAGALDRLHQRFGAAVLIDLHSMPPLGPGQPQVVIGDRQGSASDPTIVAAVEAAVRAHGIEPCRNVPYSGGHVLARHSDPSRGRHGVQLEIDRSLYLCDRLAEPGAGLLRIASLLRAIVEAVERALAAPLLAAAE